MLGGASIAGGDGRAAGHPFEAIAVERADAGERVVRMARYGEVPHLGMTKPVQDLAIDDRAAADPGPERQVDERLETPSRAPATLRQRRGVDVRIEPDRDAEGRHEWADQRRV